nr:zinc finger, CCHC-type [Tanacetum cinerariifolium]
MATLQKFKYLATKCTVAPSPTRSPSTSPVIHLRRRKTLRMLLIRTGNRRLTTHDEFTDRKGDSPENRKDSGVRRRLKDLLVASPENRRFIEVGTLATIESLKKPTSKFGVFNLRQSSSSIFRETEFGFVDEKIPTSGIKSYDVCGLGRWIVRTRCHIDEFEFKKLILDLANTDIEIEDEDQALMLLTLLSSSYENIVERLLYGRESLTMEDVLVTLNSRELKKRTEGIKEKNGDGLYVRGREALVQDGNDEMPQLVMDLGRSYHMTHKKVFLYDFKDIDGGSVK